MEAALEQQIRLPVAEEKGRTQPPPEAVPVPLIPTGRYVNPRSMPWNASMCSRAPGCSSSRVRVVPAGFVPAVQPVGRADLRVEIFDAARVGEGPIATLMGSDRETIPLILHSAWSPAHHELVDAERLSFSAELTEAALASLPDELRSSVHQVAAALDGR